MYIILCIDVNHKNIAEILIFFFFFFFFFCLIQHICQMKCESTHFSIWFVDTNRFVKSSRNGKKLNTIEKYRKNWCHGFSQFPLSNVEVLSSRHLEISCFLSPQGLGFVSAEDGCQGKRHEITVERRAEPLTNFYCHSDFTWNQLCKEERVEPRQ